MAARSDIATQPNVPWRAKIDNQAKCLNIGDSSDQNIPVEFAAILLGRINAKVNRARAGWEERKPMAGWRKVAANRMKDRVE